MVEWLSWLPCKRDFINFTILETYEDIPNTLPSLKLLEQRVRELVREQNVVGSKRLRSGTRVNEEFIVLEDILAAHGDVQL